MRLAKATVNTDCASSSPEDMGRGKRKKTQTTIYSPAGRSDDSSASDSNTVLTILMFQRYQSHFSQMRLLLNKVTYQHVPINIKTKSLNFSFSIAVRNSQEEGLQRYSTGSNDQLSVKSRNSRLLLLSSHGEYIRSRTKYISQSTNLQPADRWVYVIGIVNL